MKSIKRKDNLVYCTPSVLLVFIIFLFLLFLYLFNDFFFFFFGGGGGGVLYNHHNFFAVKSQYLEAEVHLKLLIAKVNFLGPENLL